MLEARARLTLSSTSSSSVRACSRASRSRNSSSASFVAVMSWMKPSRMVAPSSVDESAAALPHPPHLAGRGRDAIGDRPRLASCDRRLDAVPHRRRVLGMDKVAVRDHGIADEGLGRVSGDVLTPGADHLHGPGGVVGAAVDHAGQVAEQRAEGALPLLELRPRGLRGGHVAEGPDTAGRLEPLMMGAECRSKTRPSLKTRVSNTVASLRMSSSTLPRNSSGRAS